jgi:hypothetical protein
MTAFRILLSTVHTFRVLLPELPASVAIAKIVDKYKFTDYKVLYELSSACPFFFFFLSSFFLNGRVQTPHRRIPPYKTYVFCLFCLV